MGRHVFSESRLGIDSAPKGLKTNRRLRGLTCPVNVYAFFTNFSATPFMQ
jgi:hypothetical protein